MKVLKITSSNNFILQMRTRDLQKRDLSKVTSALLSTYASSHLWLQVLQSSTFELRCNLYSPWNSPGQNTGMGSLSLLQGILPTQGSNPGLQHCNRTLYQLSHKGSPRDFFFKIKLMTDLQRSLLVSQLPRDPRDTLAGGE